MTDHAAPESSMTLKNTSNDETETAVQEVAVPPFAVLGGRIGGESDKVDKESTRAVAYGNGAKTSGHVADLSLLEFFNSDQAVTESSAFLKLDESTLQLSGLQVVVPSDTSLSQKRTATRSESSSLHHHNASMRMEDVGVLMREQDADLLESIQRKGPNQTGMTPVLLASRNEFDRLFVQQIPSFSLDESPTNKAGAVSSLNDMMMMDLIHPSASAPCFDNALNTSVATAQHQLDQLMMVPSQQRSLSSHSNRSLSGRSLLVRQTSNDDRSTSALSEAQEVNSVSQPPLLEQPPHLSPLQLKERQVSLSRNRSEGYDESIPSYLPKSLEQTRRALSGDIYLREEDEQEGSVLSDRDSVDELNLNNDNEKVLRRSESAERRINEAAQFAEAVGDLPLTEQKDLVIIDEVNDEGVEVDDDDDDDDATVVRVERSRMLRPPSKNKAGVAKRAVSTDVGDASMDSVVAPPDRAQLENRSGHAVKSSSSLQSASAMCPETPVKSRPSWPIAQYETRHTDPGAPVPQLPNSRRAAFLAQLPSSTSTQDFVYKGIRSNPPEIIKRGTTRGNYAQLHRKAWLEVSDKYHRYGKHLRLYYRYWERLGFPTNMFFDWLDSKGEAAGQPLPELEECPRSQLDSDTVLYISNPEVTGNYTLQLVAEEAPVVDDDGNEEVMRRCRVLDVDGDPVKTGPDGWIFVLRDNVFYGSLKITSVIGHSKQRFHHSSFFGGKAVAAAGIFLTDDDGFLTRLYPHSGHYRPGEAHVQRILFFIFHEGIDLRTFEMDVQQIQHVSRDGDLPTKVKSPSKVEDTNKENGDESAKPEKKKKMESLQLVPAVIVACFLAHKARFIGEGIFAQIHQIRKMEVTSVVEALDVIDNGGYWKRKKRGAL